MGMMTRLGSMLIFTIMLSGTGSLSLQAEEYKSIVVYGASGRVGEVIVEEALARNYKVTGVSRTPARLQFSHANFKAVKGDILDVESIKTLAAGASALIISISAKAPDNEPENSLIVHATDKLRTALAGMTNKPYIVQVGSASMMYGSSYEEIRKNMQDAPFAYNKGTVMHAVLLGHQLSLQAYRQSDLDWTILAPPMRILGIYNERDRTTTRDSFRLSVSGPLMDAEGNKQIYVRDLARAVMDEVINRKFNRQVFTAAY